MSTEIATFPQAVSDISDSRVEKKGERVDMLRLSGAAVCRCPVTSLEGLLFAALVAWRRSAAAFALGVTG